MIHLEDLMMMSDAEFAKKVKAIGLQSVLENLSAYISKEWFLELLQNEEEFRAKNSFERKLKASKLGDFKLLADFDWSWPKKIDRNAIEELITLEFMREKENIVFIGGNGTGKTMIAKNIGIEAIKRGKTVLCASAADMLAHLSRYEASGMYTRGLSSYTRPDLLIIDELGQVSFGERHADLLFAVVNSRYLQKSTIITTNSHFRNWNKLFPNATSVVTIIDRLIHRSEVLEIDGESYRKKEAEERKELRKARRKRPKN